MIPSAKANYIFKINHFAKLPLPDNNKTNKLPIQYLKTWIYENNSRISERVAAKAMARANIGNGN